MLRQVTEDEQTATAAFLMDPASYGLAATVESMETHISRIFLTGERAFMMKRGVKLPYVDFSTPALRLAACRKEVKLNARTAPDLYLGVRRITRENDGPDRFRRRRRSDRRGRGDGPLQAGLPF